MNIPFPRWAWWIIAAFVCLALVVILKVNCHVGSGGAGISQDLIH